MVQGGGYYFWLGASAEPTGLGSAKALEPVKPSPRFACHPSRDDCGWATVFILLAIMALSLAIFA